VLLFLIVGVLGTACDQIHVQFEVLAYPSPFLLGQALWVPLVFGAASVFIVASYAPFRRLAPRDEPPPSAAALAFVAADFLAAYFATGIFKGTPVALALGLTLAWVAVLAARFSLDRVLFGLAVALGGVLVETALSALGGFHYNFPYDGARALGHVPLWLPALYLHVALLTRVVARRFFAPEGPTSVSRGDTRDAP
jgi:hypothetical protein